MNYPNRKNQRSGGLVKLLAMFSLSFMILPLWSMGTNLNRAEGSSLNSGAVLKKHTPRVTQTIQPTSTGILSATATNPIQPTSTNPAQPTSTAPLLPTATRTVLPTIINTATLPATNGQIMWGAYNNGVPFDMSKLGTFETQAGKSVSIVHWGQPWKMNGAMQPFQTTAFQSVRDHGSIPMLNWGSWYLGQGVSQADFQLSDIYNGAYDTYITLWAQTARNWGHPFFLRFDHEMNGWWYPWSEQVNGNQAGDYVKAWRHVHDIFVSVGATNVSWVWSINEIGSQTTPAASLYPGSAYVDWVAIDAYNKYTGTESSWRSFYSIFKATYDQLNSIDGSKPIMISEFASSEYTGGDASKSKAAWIQDAIQTQIPTNFPRIKAVVWFNWNDTAGKTYTIDSSQAALDAFRSSIASSYYGEDIFSNLSSTPIGPIQ